MLRQAGLIDDAIAEYKRIGTTDRNFGLKVALRLARIYVDTARLDDGVRALRETLRLDLGDEMRAYVYGELGWAYKEQGLLEAALAAYRKSLELQPDNAKSLEGIQLVEGALARES